MYRDYIQQLTNTISMLNIDEIKSAQSLILECYRNNGRIYIVGNGGSAAASSHWVCDLSKINVKNLKRLEVFSLTDNASWMTAISNDFSYEAVFVEQLINLIKANDLLIGISASGNSMNVVKAVEYSKSIGAKSLGVVGFAGGKLKETADGSVHILSDNYGIVEDIQLAIGHMISQAIKRELEEGIYG